MSKRCPNVQDACRQMLKRQPRAGFGPLPVPLHPHAEEAQMVRLLPLNHTTPLLEWTLIHSFIHQDRQCGIITLQSGRCDVHTSTKSFSFTLLYKTIRTEFLHHPELTGSFCGTFIQNERTSSCSLRKKARVLIWPFLIPGVAPFSLLPL